MDTLENEIVKFVAEKTGKTVEEVNDTEPFHLHQGEVIELIKSFHNKKNERVRDNSMVLFGLMMRPSTDTVEKHEKIFGSSDYSVTKDFIQAYRNHIAAMEIVAGCAKHYILKNYEKVEEWGEMDVVVEDNSDEVTDYYHFKKRRMKFAKSAPEKVLDRIDEGNMKRHNPVKTVTNVVLDSSDGDFSLTINGKDHLWISDDSVIVIADYIEEQIKKQETKKS